MNTKYSRNFLIPDWDQNKQKALKNSRVLIAGAGGLGNPVLLYLTSAGIGEITIVDYDIIDETNLNRQIIYDEEKVGEYKAEISMKKALQLNSLIKIKTIIGRVEDINYEVVSKHDLIIDCLDNFKSKLKLNKISVDLQIPLLHGGVSEFQGQLSLFVPGKTACLNCIISDEQESGAKGIIGSITGVIGSLQATEAIKYLAGYTKSLNNQILFFNGRTMEFKFLSIKKNPHCKTCSSQKGA